MSSNINTYARIVITIVIAVPATSSHPAPATSSFRCGPSVSGKPIYSSRIESRGHPHCCHRHTALPLTNCLAMVSWRSVAWPPWGLCGCGFGWCGQESPRITRYSHVRRAADGIVAFPRAGPRGCFASGYWVTRQGARPQAAVCVFSRQAPSQIPFCLVRPASTARPRVHPSGRARRHGSSEHIGDRCGTPPMLLPPRADFPTAGHGEAEHGCIMLHCPPLQEALTVVLRFRK